MLDLAQLTRSYGDFVAVDDVSFSINKGEILGLLGHNGAGKTSIMKMIVGYLEPDRGTVTVDGVSLADQAKTIQRSLGYLPENLPVYPEMTVADYLDYAAELKGLVDDAKLAEIRRVIEATAIAEKLMSPIANLSRGYKQRVGVAQALLGKPKLLILDEPTNGLDPEQTRHMRELIRDIARDATVILSTHIMQEVEALCTRVVMLRSGKLVVDARLDDLKQSDQLSLSTSLGQEAIDTLRGIDGVVAVDAIDAGEGLHEYRIRVQDPTQLRSIGASISRAVIEAGGELYSLQAETRDLEALFREVNEGHVQNGQQGGVKDAA